MLVDTDVLIWALRGQPKATAAIDAADPREVSVVTHMELIQGARDKKEIRLIKDFLANLGFRMLPLSENIGHRAAIYVEEYALSGGMTMADALVAATAVEAHEPLLTAITKHHKSIKDLDVRQFRP